jgi:hypothetical protein
MSRKAWEFAQTHHTLENFAKQYRTIIKRIMNDPLKRNISSQQIMNVVRPSIPLNPNLNKD